MNAHTEKTLNELLPQLYKQLEAWCITYKLIGSRDETPRYSQIMRRGGSYVLKSTQKDLYYDLTLTQQQAEILMYSDANEIWNWWKSKRTEYLIANHKTIDAV